jgi:TolB-like protein/class 3 adenylate cyclase/Tfp pilus assembly protein PilF
MPSEIKNEIEFEIGHVLFIDIVGYSKLLITEQSEQLQTLKQIVRGTEQFRLAEAEGKLLRLPTGDGGALVFRTSPEVPVKCALEISKELKSHPELRVRMGIHSGPVNEITDLNEQANIAGAGINIAQRIMDCGDAGHILLSQHVAEDLEQYPRWRSHLHDLGECEVKHGVRVSVVNLCTEELGNPAVPEKLKAARLAAAARRKRVAFRRLSLSALALLAALAAIALILFRYNKQRSAAARVAIPNKSIAVLPFENLSRDPDNAFFTDGVQDEILTDLAKIADLKVISRTSVMQYKSGIARNLREIGQQLRVAHVIEGSVQRAANRIRVNAQLIDARNDAHLWAQTYDRDLADVFAIQSEIAKAIADQLQAKLSPRERTDIEQAPTADVTAFALYSRAQTLILSTSFSSVGRKSLSQAVDLLNQALARDPSFFLAQCQLAYSHDELYFLNFDHTPARLAAAEAAVEAASRLRPDAGETHLARANHFYCGYLDYDKALAELASAQKTLPNDARVFELTGYIARRRGKYEEALRDLERALELDPRNFFTLQQVALTHYNLRRYREVAAILDRALIIKPDDVETKTTRALVELDWKADTRPLHQTIDEIRTQNPAGIQNVADIWLLLVLAERDTVAASAALAALGENTFGNDAMQFNRTFCEALIARMTKDEDKARAAFTKARAQQEKVVQAQPGYGPALCILGMIDAGLGRKEDALREGRRAIDLLPVEKDSINGAHMIEYFAIIAAWIGERDLAFEQLGRATRLLSYGTVSYGQLKLLPYWDPLRGDPRFEKIVASLARK